MLGVFGEDVSFIVKDSIRRQINLFVGLDAFKV